MWELNPVLCTNFTARGVTIDTHGYNNDGCDPENRNYVLIENASSTPATTASPSRPARNRDGRELGEAGHPTQNLIIRNNTFADGHGGIACRSEMSGGIKNLFADNNTFDSPTLNYALRFKTNAEQRRRCGEHLSAQLQGQIRRQRRRPRHHAVRCGP